MSKMYSACRTVLDRIIAALLLVALLPVMVVVTIMVRCTMGRPVIFAQVRPGRFAQPFRMLKFRTMTESFDSLGRPLADRDRLTRLGRFLRRTSLDELPELWNVVRGEMALIGPRPLLARYMPFFTERECLRFEVRPGITGWAQVHGRNAATWDERLAYDVWYVENRCFRVDVKIIALTVFQVVRAHGVAVDPTAVMDDLDEERSRAA